MSPAGAAVVALGSGRILISDPGGWRQRAWKNKEKSTRLKLNTTIRMNALDLLRCCSVGGLGMRSCRCLLSPYDACALFGGECTHRSRPLDLVNKAPL